jgi:hypothetical protein
MFKAIIVECRSLCEAATKEQKRAGLEASWKREKASSTPERLAKVGDNPDITTKRRLTRPMPDITDMRASLKKRIDKDPQGTHDREGYKYPAEQNRIHKLPYAQKRLSDFEPPSKLPAATALSKKKPGLMSRLASVFKK